MLNLVKVNCETKEKFYNLVCKGLTDRSTGTKYFFVGIRASKARVEGNVIYAIPAISRYHADCMIAEELGISVSELYR